MNSLLSPESGNNMGMNTLKAICSMIKTEDYDGAYNPLLKHLYCNDSNTELPTLIDLKCRSKMLEWSFKMVDFFNIDRSIVSISTFYQDRFLSTTLGSPALASRDKFRIASVTCLYIAIKLYIPHKGNVTAHAFAKLCRGAISGDSIVDTEIQILFALSWNVHPPIPMSNIEMMMELITATRIRNALYHDPDNQEEDSVVGDLILPSSSDASSLSYTTQEECTLTAVRARIIELVQYQVELALKNGSFIHVRSSVLALATLLNAIEGVKSENNFEVLHVSSFCQHSIAVVAKILLVSNVATKREMAEVRAGLLRSVLIAPDGTDCGLIPDVDPNVKPPCFISTTEVTSSPTWNLIRESETFASPKSTLSRVFDMYSQCIRP